MSGVLDLAFAVSGERVQPDYAWSLYRALLRALPWLDEEPALAIHPLRNVSAMPDAVMLGRRAQLVLRIPAARLEDCRALSGARLELEEEPLQVGAAAQRPLKAYPVLYSPLVATGSEEEGRFQADAQRLAAEAGVACRLIVGRRREARAGGEARLAGYGLMLHGLTAEHSIRLQAQGLGEGRKLGCGVFIPHKSIAPVGASADWEQ